MKRIFVLFVSFVFLFLLAACDDWMRPMSDFIERATNSAFIYDFYIRPDSNRMKSGNIAIPVNKETEIILLIRNPQKYDLNLYLIDSETRDPIEMDIGVVSAADGQSATITIPELETKEREKIFDFTVVGEYDDNRKVFPAFPLPKMETRCFDNTLSSVAITSPSSVKVTDPVDEISPYTAIVGADTSSIDITATVPKVFSSVATQNGQIVAKEETTGNDTIAISNNITDIKIFVTADCERTKEYTLRVIRELLYCTVAFNGNGAIGTAPEEISEILHTAITLPDNVSLTKAGYSFDGWSSSPDGEKIAGEYTIINNVTLYAVWKQIAVTNISGVITEMNAGTPAFLNGTIVPATSLAAVNNFSITWSVKNAEGTGASIVAGTNILNATSSGTAVITATITNGVSTGSDYTQDFNIKVNSTPDFTVSFSVDGAPIAVLDFGTVQVGYVQPDPTKVTFKNTGGKGFAYTYVEVHGDDANCFTTYPNSSSNLGGNNDYFFNPGREAEFTIRPKADLPVGVYEATVWIYAATGPNDYIGSFIVRFTVTE